jgi:hypothetical protein
MIADTYFKHYEYPWELFSPPERLLRHELTPAFSHLRGILLVSLTTQRHPHGSFALRSQALNDRKQH